MIAVALGAWLLSALVVAILVGRTAEQSERTRLACHELRGAISAVALGIELSQRTGTVPAQRARALQLELGRATQALDDLAGGRARRDAHDEINVTELLADSVEAWRPAAPGRTVALDVGRCCDPFVTGHRARLAQATGNLIANAIEHGAGAVTVSARSGQGIVRIEVCDEGAGLPASLADLLRAPSRFAWPRADRARGHGLRIAAEAVRAHGGRLELAPSRGGARLVLKLPLATARAAGEDLPAPVDAG